MKQAAISSGRKFIKPLLYITGSLLLLLIAGYFIANMVIRKKVDEALRSLPASLRVEYSQLRANVLTGSLDLEGVRARYMPASDHAASDRAHEVSVNKIAISGFSVFSWIRSDRLRIRNIRLEGVIVQVDEELLEKDSGLQRMKPPSFDMLIGQVEISGLAVAEIRKGNKVFSMEGDLQLDSVTRDTVAGMHFVARRGEYAVPDMDETIGVRQLEIDSKKKFLRVDTIEIRPTLGREEIGRLKGHQVDVVKAAAEGLEVTGIDVMGLLRHRLYADQISLRSSRVHIFRDRRLPLEAGDKAMPMEALEALSLDLRVEQVLLGPTRFEYEEFPKVGDSTGKLVIEGFHGTMAPLVNNPRPGDPAFITVTTEGSLMGSGVVKATTRMPFHKHGFYKVEGAFHNLDVTRLNNPAEHLGQLHLESGMLNSLVFQFEMGEDRATGKIVGEYHDLVVDKLKEKDGQLKKDKLKSFALKKLIIPKDKDKSLPLSKRTGKVDNPRVRERYFSYYLLHSLLVGVKSSFSLGFLLPG
jgi:hypothetical protein